MHGPQRCFSTMSHTLISSTEQCGTSHTCTVWSPLTTWALHCHFYIVVCSHGSEFDGQASPIQNGECEVSESEVNNHNGDMVGVAKCTLLSPSESVAVVSLDRLFRNPRRRSRVAPMPIGTYLFSDRTCRRWELAKEQVCTVGEGDVLQA